MHNLAYALIKVREDGTRKLYACRSSKENILRELHFGPDYWRLKTVPVDHSRDLPDSICVQVWKAENTGPINPLAEHLLEDVFLTNHVVGVELWVFNISAYPPLPIMINAAPLLERQQNK